MPLPTKLPHLKYVNPFPEMVDKINEIIDCIEDVICEPSSCCTCHGCPRHPNGGNWEEEELTLAQKFQEFRAKHGQGSGKEYWKGLERIAMEHNKLT